MATNIANAPDALRSEVRRAIAKACLNEPRSVGDVARDLDRPDGSIRVTVDKMARDGVLKVTRLRDRQARGYIVTPAWSQIVEDLTGSARSVRLVPQARILVISGRLDQLLIGLSNASEEPGFGWAARLGPTRFLVCLEGDTNANDDIQVRLLRLGLTVEVSDDVRGVSSASEVRTWAARADRDRQPLEFQPTSRGDGS